MVDVWGHVLYHYWPTQTIHYGNPWFLPSKFAKTHLRPQNGSHDSSPRGWPSLPSQCQWSTQYAWTHGICVPVKGSTAMQLIWVHMFCSIGK